MRFYVYFGFAFSGFCSFFSLSSTCRAAGIQKHLVIDRETLQTLFGWTLLLVAEQLRIFLCYNNRFTVNEKNSKDWLL